jgi:uncharacterized protein (TIGR02996 family)
MTEDAFLQAIRDAPDDDAPRLVYADWLDESGDPARAELIRVQCELVRRGADDGPLQREIAYLDDLYRIGDRQELLHLLLRLGRYLDADAARLELKQREEALLEGVLAAWARDWGLHPQWCLLRRGLPWHVGAGSTLLLERGEELFRHAPVESLDLIIDDRNLPRALRLPFLGRLAALRVYLQEEEDRDDLVPGMCGAPLSRLKTLVLSQVGLTDESLGMLAADASLDNITQLHLEANEFGAAGVEALLTSKRLTRLTSLHLRNNALGNETLQALARHPRSRQFTTLDLGYGEFSDEAVVALAGSRQVNGLRHLYLDGDWLGLETVRALAESRHLAGLSTLNLQDQSVGAEGVRLLARSPHLTNLTTLFFGWSFMEEGDDGAEALSGSASLSNLTALSLRGTWLSGRGMEALGRAGCLSNLRWLGLDSCGPGLREGLRSLIESPALQSLVALDLSANDLGDKGASLLASLPALARLRELDLSNSKMGAKGAMALAASPGVARLSRLALYYNEIGDAGAKALASSPYLGGITSLEVLHSNRITDAGRAALVERFGKRVQ